MNLLNMKSKKNELILLKEKLGLIVRGIDNYNPNEINVVLSNHRTIRDIFYIPASLSSDIVSIVSSRFVYKKVEEKQKLVDKYLNVLPFETHGGSVINNYNIKSAVELLKNSCSVQIFPEGAYLNDGNNDVTQGRNGAIRILFKAMDLGMDINIIPVGIRYNDEFVDVDSIELNDKDVEISILPKLNIKSRYNDYNNTDDYHLKKIILDDIVKESLSLIANDLNYNYIDEQIVLFDKLVMNHKCIEFSFDEANELNNLIDFKNNMDETVKKLIL